MEKFKLSQDEIREICEKDEKLDQIKTTDELKRYFEQKTTKGLWLKDIMLAVGIAAENIPPEKHERAKWILENIEVEGIYHVKEKPAEEVPTQIQDEAEEGAGAAIAEITLEDAGRARIKDVNALLSRIAPSKITDITEKLDVTSFILYEGMSVSYQDGFCIQDKEGYCGKLVAIAKRNEDTVAAVGILYPEGERYHIILKREDIDYSLFGSNRNYRLVLFDAEAERVLATGQAESIWERGFEGHVYISTECQVSYKKLEDTSNALCIDFGTSNTSVGSYGLLNRNDNHIELVSFTDVTTPEMKETKLYSTIVYVDDCSDVGDVRYLFGYEAKKKVMDKGYTTDASVFFEIKRWISSLDEEEEICDEYGNVAAVKRKEIVKAYILHVIQLAKQYFKVNFNRLHLSAPVKLKEKFNREIRELLLETGYEVLPAKDSLDEGVAIIYNSISRLMEEKLLKDNTSIMILDCGGGTTDLASCEVSCKKLMTGQKLEINTKFVNGNSNFGGNNITFRILQLIKIKLAAKFAPEKMAKYELIELIPYEESEILSRVEADYRVGEQYNSDSQNDIYEKFNNAYKKAEEVIPTFFQNVGFRGEARKIKRNYFYLWQFAEKMKVKFYEEDLVQVNFKREEDRALTLDTLDNYYLYIRDGNELVKKELDDLDKEFLITINEIRRILCGDIYGLLNDLLSQNGFEVTDYKYYRLAGQSCKITLFMELLKEFIPGRQLRTNSAVKKYEGSATGSIRLKLDCICGSIAYIRDKECGKIKPEISTMPSKLIYDVFVNRVDSEYPILKKDESDFVGLERFSQDAATKAEILVKNAYGAVERKIVLNLQGEEAKRKGLDEVFEDIEQYSTLPEKALEKLETAIRKESPNDSDESELEMLVFAVPSNEGYGMRIYRLYKRVTDDKQEYGLCVPIYENYENESEKSFFDGRR